MIVVAILFGAVFVLAVCLLAVEFLPEDADDPELDEKEAAEHARPVSSGVTVLPFRPPLENEDELPT